MHPIDSEKACPFVGDTLRELRRVVGDEATVLGFVGCPYTLATYLVEASCFPFLLTRPILCALDLLMWSRLGLTSEVAQDMEGLRDIARAVRTLGYTLLKLIGRGILPRPRGVTRGIVF